MRGNVRSWDTSTDLSKGEVVVRYTTNEWSSWTDQRAQRMNLHQWSFGIIVGDDESHDHNVASRFLYAVRFTNSAGVESWGNKDGWNYQVRLNASLFVSHRPDIVSGFDTFSVSVQTDVNVLSQSYRIDGIGEWREGLVALLSSIALGDGEHSIQFRIELENELFVIQDYSFQCLNGVVPIDAWFVVPAESASTLWDMRVIPTGEVYFLLDANNIVKYDSFGSSNTPLSEVELLFEDSGRLTGIFVDEENEHIFAISRDRITRLSSNLDIDTSFGENGIASVCGVFIMSQQICFSSHHSISS